MRESRRTFLGRVGRLAAASMTLGARSLRGESMSDTQPATRPSESARPYAGPIDPADKSRVVLLRAPEAAEEENLLREMVEEAIRILTGAESSNEAWRKLLRPDDVIAIKFNRVGEKELGITEPMARQLVHSLGQAGFAPERIMLIEAPDTLVSRLKTRPRVFGWSGPEVSFGSGRDRLVAWLEEVTAIINVPFLKTHNIAGMTGCLKNLSHAVVRSPGRYHANGCAPYVGDIVALPQIRSKVRLHLMNAMRAVFDGGPEVRPENRWIYAGIVAGMDPVAVDSVGVDILNEQRIRAKLPPIAADAAGIPHLRAAAQKGLGTNDQDYIELIAPASMF